jgi:hypothetical protein
MRSGLTTRSTLRFSAFITPIRAIIACPPQLQSTSMAVRHSGKSDSFFGSFVMQSAASFSVSSCRPSGKMIGSFQHVQAITVAIDQYAEKALGNRDYFLNKPYGVG